MSIPNKPFDAGRRSALRAGLTIAAGLTAATATLRSRPAFAAKAPKVTMMYQGTPHGNQRCDNCIHFTPGKTPDADGTCAVVDGNIAPQAWCVVYAPKS